jgi:hypothetical protein
MGGAARRTHQTLKQELSLEKMQNRKQKALLDAYLKAA